MTLCGNDEERVLYLYGEPCGDFERHMAGCPECREFIRDAMEVREWYSRSSDETPPKGLADRMIARTTVMGRSNVIRFAVGAVAAAALIAVMLHPFVARERGAQLQQRAKSVVVAVDDDIRTLMKSTERLTPPPTPEDAAHAVTMDSMIDNARILIGRHTADGDPAIDGEIARLRYRAETVAFGFPD